MQGTIENVFHLMVNVMVTFKGLNVDRLGAKLISMGYDGNNVFQGAEASVIT